MSDLVIPAAVRLEPGIYFDLPEKIYHADPAIEPSLSAGFAKTMLETSPRRASAGHPRLNSAWEPMEPSSFMDEGSILHTLMMGAGPQFRVINARDYKTDAAKNLKAKARADGVIPILAHKMEELEVIASSARQLIDQDPENRQVLSDDYASEVSMIWREPTGAMCRARADRLHRTDGSKPIYDFKFTDRLKNPADWDRAVVDSWWDMRAAFYARGAAELRDGEEPTYRFIVVEKEPPVDVMVFELTRSFMELGGKKAATAIYAWERCVSGRRFPAYPRRTFHIEEPGWAESKWLQRSSVEHMLPADPNALPEPATRAIGGLREHVLASEPPPYDSPLEGASDAY